MNIKSTLKQYHELPYLEKRVLQLKALSRANLSKTDFLRVLNDSDLKTFLGKQFNNNILTPIFQNLTNKKLLHSNNQVTTNVLHQITLDAVNGEYSVVNTESLLKIAHNNSSSVDKLRLAIYLNKPVLLHEAIRDTQSDIFVYNIIQRLAQDFNSTIFTDEMLKGLAPEIRYWLIITRIYCILQSNHNVKINEITIIKEWVDNELIRFPITSNVVLDILLDFFFLRGDLDKIAYLAERTRNNPMKNQAILGVMKFLRDDQSQALAHFDAALKTTKELSKKRNVCLSGIYGICHILSLLKANQPDNHSKIQDLLKHYISLSTLYTKELERSRYRGDIPEIPQYFTQHHDSSYRLLMLLVDFLRSGIDAKKISEQILFITNSTHKVLDNVLDGFILFLVLYWTKSKAIDIQKYASELHAMYNEVLPALISVLPEQLDTATTTENNKLDVASLQAYTIDFTGIVKSKDEWERVLDNLNNYFNKNEVTKSYDKRLVWMLYPNKYREMIVPVEQKRTSNASSTWNKGRPASLKRLYETQHNLDYLTEYDKAVLSCAKSDYSHYSNFYIDSDKALLALINNPLVFDGDTGAHIELTKTTPELIFKEVKGNFFVKLSESANMQQPTVKLKKESDNKYQVVEISQSTLDIVKILGNNGIKVPKVARNKVLSLLQQAAANISIRTEFDSTEGLESEPGDANLIMQLTFIDEILKARLFVRPFSGKGSYYKPGKGNSSIVAQIDNSYKSVSRDLRLERDNVSHLLQTCPILQEQDCIDYEWQIAELETALEILQQLNNYKHNKSLTIEWPKGQSLFVDREISFTDLKLNITGNNQWFNFDGSITIDDTQVMEMRIFLQNLEQAKGRFIELSDKRFIALTASFAKRMQELKKAARIDEKGQSIHKLGAPLLQEFVDNSTNSKTDNYWQTHINKINSTNNYDPKIPHNLQAELRPYQIEGFKWLARLSNLGFGACLADDMGLGKTVQTIALLLEQAVQGACLVVAPASVCYVWQEECQKFAPSLKCIILGSNNREEQIAALTKMDVLICSYGLLYQVGELLTSRQFQVIVLDEAQAIKNNTKRFKIITELQAVNRIALSGTPIENRTEELWNLFEFLNPGFLGSRQLFQEKYTKPIERGTDVIARNTLKRLIQPFILRRMKSKVLDELPSKTEQTIFIEPSDEEKNFYEALRRESLERISSISDADSAKKRFSILAEITKLRRACCDCSLINNDIEIPNSKLEAFDEIVQELKENNHRALVFSQYVDYLTIVRKRLEQQQISYQYLDGSTPQKQRKASVKAFQGGEGDLFLLSLKAGGVGLNLTAADYVIHLDPWWNPAVEDQASDRAHRLGQTRPVTVYRLVMKHSIEEKILKMHRDKRDLAIGLLDDSEKSASLTEVDLLELISQASL
jgi:SNF2 family DNA or RNA helicase